MTNKKNVRATGNGLWVLLQLLDEIERHLDKRALIRLSAVSIVLRNRRLTMPEFTGTAPEVQKVAQIFRLLHACIRDDDVSALAFCRDLQSVDLGDTSVSDLSALAACKKLRWLNLSGSKVLDLSTLAERSMLQWLDLSYMPQVNLSALTACTRLGCLNLEGTEVTSLKPLTALPLLKKLQISCNSETDLLPLTECRVLHTLSLGTSEADDLSALASCPALQLLTLDLGWPKIVGTLRWPSLSFSMKVAELSAANSALYALRTQSQGSDERPVLPVSLQQLSVLPQASRGQWQRENTDILQSCVHLQQLTIQSSFHLKNANLSPCQSLVAVDLSGCRLITHVDVSDCRALQSLNLSECSNLYSVYLSRSITELHLRWCIALQQSGFDAILNYCTALKILCLHGCQRYADLSELPRLRFLQRLDLTTRGSTPDIGKLLELPSLTHVDLDDRWRGVGDDACKYFEDFKSRALSLGITVNVCTANHYTHCQDHACMRGGVRLCCGATIVPAAALCTGRQVD